MTTTLTVEDRLDILDLYARYTHAIDSGDERAWVDTFIPDGSLNLGYGPVTQGQDALLQWCTAFLESTQQRLRHYTTNITLDSATDTARGRAYILILDRASGNLVHSGTYEDHLVHTDTGWKFASRALTPDVYSTAGTEATS